MRLSEGMARAHCDSVIRPEYVKEVCRLMRTSNISIVKGDIVDAEFINDLFKKHQFDSVIHLAAESHVDNSISSPADFIHTNIVGTFNLLDIAKHYWMNAPFETKQGCEHNRFLHISTDEVYGTLGETGAGTGEILCLIGIVYLDFYFFYLNY
mgnify:CR=1 FL=1